MGAPRRTQGIHPHPGGDHRAPFAGHKPAPRMEPGRDRTQAGEPDSGHPMLFHDPARGRLEVIDDAGGEREMSPSDADRSVIQVLRALALDTMPAAREDDRQVAVTLAPLIFDLLTRALRWDPLSPAWVARDRVVSSPGPARAVLHAAMHLAGHPVTLAELEALSSQSPGTHGIDEPTPTAWLDADPPRELATAVGLALAQASLAERLNHAGDEIVGYRTVVVGESATLRDGLAEGAACAAGRSALDKLVVFWADRRSESARGRGGDPSEGLLASLVACGWRTLAIDDVESASERRRGLEAAWEADRPTVVRVGTTRALPEPPELADGGDRATGPEAGATATAAPGWDRERLAVLASARRHADQRARGARSRREWEARWASLRASHPESADELDRVLGFALSARGFEPSEE